VLCSLAFRHCSVELTLRAIVEVRPSRRIDGRLGTWEDELPLRNTGATHPRPDLRSGIITGIAVEIPTVPILARLSTHGEPNIHILALLGLTPSINLQNHAERQLNMYDMKRLACPAVLHDCALAVVLDSDLRICVVPVASQVCETKIPHSCTVPGDGLHANDELTVVDE